MSLLLPPCSKLGSRKPFFLLSFQEYTENLRHYVTTMVCVSVKGKATAGVIHKPFDPVSTVWGWAGPDLVNPTLAADAEDNRVRQHKDLAASRLIVSRSHAGHVHEVAEAAFGPGAEVTPAGGAGFKAWEVMRGKQVRGKNSVKVSSYS